MAGFTFSSLPPESISMSHPQTIKRIEQSPATKTMRDTPTLIISAGVYEPEESIIEPAAETF